jgi:hypothetical protein
MDGIGTGAPMVVARTWKTALLITGYSRGYYLAPAAWILVLNRVARRICKLELSALADIYLGCRMGYQA